METAGATPPFPSDLAPAGARRQALVLLVVFYAVIYGIPALMGRAHYRPALPVLSALLIGALMLLIVLLFVRRDRSRQDSLGLQAYAARSALAWGLFGFVASYAMNLVLTAVFVLARGNPEAVAAGRAEWLGALAKVPVILIVPLAAFAALWEEIVFRGFLLGRMRAAIPARGDGAVPRWRDPAAVVLTAIFFGAGHGYQGVLGLGQTTVAGLVLGALAVWRGSVWPAIGTHLLIDVFGLLVIQALKSALPTGG
jgi:membrane protease YdiL (CAAX protease family)